MDILGISNILNAASSGIETVFGKSEDRDKAKLALAQLQAQPQLAQLLINQVEAANPNWFVAGWRPAAGWVCVLGLLYQFLIRPITQALLLKYDVIMPSLDIEDLMALLSGMLGLGFYRMREKQDNVAR